jgi:hypothetical protein
VAKPVFRDPLVADRAKVLVAAALLPGTYERNDRSDDRQACNDPDSIHRRSHELLRTGATCIRFKFHISPHVTQRQ